MSFCIHIGYHKTATTWLQRQVFVPEMGCRQLLDHAEVDQLIIQPHDLDFDPEFARVAIQASRVVAPPNTCHIVSSENLSGHPFFGGKQSATLAHRLQQVAPDAKILISVRSQETMLPSVYMQYLQRGGTLRMQEFFKGVGGFGYPGFEVEHFFYDRLVALYQSLFDTVHVTTYEHLSSNPNEALALFSPVMGRMIGPLDKSRKARVSPSLSQGMAPLLRRANHLRQSTLNPSPVIALSKEQGWLYRAICAGAKSRPAKVILAGRTSITDYVKSEFKGRFTESNRRLDALTGKGLDLSNYP